MSAARAIGLWRGVYAGLAFFALSYVTVRLFLPDIPDRTTRSVLGTACNPVPDCVAPRRILEERPVGLCNDCRRAVDASRSNVCHRCTRSVARLEVRRECKAASLGGCLRGGCLRAGRWREPACEQGIRSGTAPSPEATFSYTLCGLSIGTDWNGCLERYDEVKNLTSEKLLTDFMYQKALENIAAQPEVIVEPSLSSVSAICPGTACRAVARLLMARQATLRRCGGMFFALCGRGTAFRCSFAGERRARLRSGC